MGSALTIRVVTEAFQNSGIFKKCLISLININIILYKEEKKEGKEEGKGREGGREGKEGGKRNKEGQEGHV